MQRKSEEMWSIDKILRLEIELSHAGQCFFDEHTRTAGNVMAEYFENEKLL